MASGDLVPRQYGSFRGVDFRGEEIDITRSPDCKNVWKDYRKTDGIRTRPCMKLITSFEDTVYGVFFYTAGDTEMMLVHCGQKLYKVVNEEKTLIYEGLNETESNAFVYNNYWYFKDGKSYLVYDGGKISDVVGYVPTTSIGRSPLGGGTVNEDINLLSDYRINTFCGDESSTEFYLDMIELDNEIPVVTVDGEQVEVSSFDPVKGVVTLKSAPPAPLTGGQDNVKIKFRRTVDKSKILNCTLTEVFDNRVFFSGNKDYPNKIWHSSLDEPAYCADLDYYNEGLDTAAVKGMVAGNNALWVFREPSQANTTVFYHTPTIDSEYGKIYPSSHSSISTGCIGKAINFNDDIVFFSDRGMEGINGDITTEQVISHRSSLVDRKLTSEESYADMLLAEWDGYLVVITGNKAYLADSRAMFQNESHYEYEWFYWEFSKNITSVRVNKGILYLGTGDGVYSLTDTEGNIESYWVTPKDKFSHPHYLKTTNKKGCTCEAEGDISLYAKTEKTDFELIGTFEDITDYFIGRIKRKKFKDIQLKFYSGTRFTLETATLECFIGGYIKR